MTLLEKHNQYLLLGNNLMDIISGDSTCICSIIIFPFPPLLSLSLSLSLSLCTDTYLY